jgi:hypothetical protein
MSVLKESGSGHCASANSHVSGAATEPLSTDQDALADGLSSYVGADPSDSSQNTNAMSHNRIAAINSGDDQETNVQGQTAVVVADSAGGQQPPAIASNALLLLTAEAVDDIEKSRIAMQNRLRAMRDDHGLEGTKEAERAAVLCDELIRLEKHAISDLEHAMKTHPLGPWVKQAKGIGLKQCARLLAAIGDPYIRPAREHEDGTVEPERPRTVAELWAYCGYHVIDGAAVKRRKGVKANWSTVAKSRAYLVAKSCVMQLTKPCAKDDETELTVHVDDCRCGRYRLAYDYARLRQEGRDITKGHKDNRAVRYVAKLILSDLWEESQRLAGATPDSPGSQMAGAPATSDEPSQTEIATGRDPYTGSSFGDAARIPVPTSQAEVAASPTSDSAVGESVLSHIGRAESTSDDLSQGWDDEIQRTNARSSGSDEPAIVGAHISQSPVAGSSTSAAKAKKRSTKRHTAPATAAATGEAS